MLLFVLFAIREVPQESTGFSLFDVRGPLYVLKESWSAQETTEDDIITYVMGFV